MINLRIMSVPVEPYQSKHANHAVRGTSSTLVHHLLHDLLKYHHFQHEHLSMVTHQHLMHENFNILAVNAIFRQP